MSNAYFEVPDPINEPIKAYGPGSAEKEELKAKLAELKALFEEEAKENNVYPLDGDIGPRFAKMQARAAPQPDWPDEPPEDLHKPALPPGTPEDPDAEPIAPGPSIVAKNLKRAQEYEKDHPWDHPGIRDLYLDIVTHALPGSAERYIARAERYRRELTAVAGR